jgi:hypothetical protein
MPNNLPPAVAAQLKAAEDLTNQINNPSPDPNNPDPIPAPAPDPTPDPAPAPAPAPEPEDFKSKYDTLTGKYNAEVPRLYGEVGDLKVKLAEAIAIINDFKVKQDATPAKPIEPPAGLAYLRKEMPELEEAINFLFEQRATELIAAKIDPKLKETDTKINNLEDTTVKGAYNVFSKTLSDAVPNWKVLNEDPGFLKWLEDVEPYSGLRKADLIVMAHDNLDASRVSQFFLDYIKSTGKTPAPPAPDPAKFVAPPKPSGGGEPQLPNEKDFVTTQEISAFYNDVAMGRYKGREDERAKYEAKINNALATGKIR